VFPIQRLARTSHASEGIHALCSRRWPGGNFLNVAVAVRWSFNAAVRSAGTGSGAFPARAGREGAPDAEDRLGERGGLRDGGGDAGSDRVGMRVHLALGKLNVSQILLRTQSGAGSHIRGCL